MKLPLITTGMICFLGICNFAQATVSPDRTRIIFNASNKSATVRLPTKVKSILILLNRGLKMPAVKKRVITFQHCRRWNVLSLMNRYKFA